MGRHIGIAILLLSAGLAKAQSPQPSPTPPAYSESVQVTASRIPEDIDAVPESIQIITAQELRDRGATDLRSALALAAGDEKGTRVQASGGSHGSGGFALASSLPRGGGFDSSLSGDFERRGFEDDRSSFKKAHLLWRNRRGAGSGVFSFDLDGNVLRQEPASPTPREGRALSEQVPVDSNHNPEGSPPRREPVLRASRLRPPTRGHGLGDDAVLHPLGPGAVPRLPQRGVERFAERHGLQGGHRRERPLLRHARRVAEVVALAAGRGRRLPFRQGHGEG